jgi:hypothetical protein
MGAASFKSLYQKRPIREHAAAQRCVAGRSRYSTKTYRDMLIPGVNSGGGGFGPGTPGAMFSTTNLGNGMFFSAGTNLGKGSMAGTPPGGNMGAAGPKPSRPAVALKLSF